MNYAYEEDYRGHDRAVPAAEAMPADRAAFIRRTYAHLAGALLAMGLLCAAAISVINPQYLLVRYSSNTIMLGSLIVFMIGATIAHYWAYQRTSSALQYAGLGLYVVLMSAVTAPLLLVASVHYPGIITQAAVLTGAVFLGLTACVFTTRKDFSALGPILWTGSLILLGAIVASIFIGGNTLSLVICIAGVALMCGFIIYETSNVLHHYETDQHVAASLALFSSVATLFRFILILLMHSRD